MEEGEPISAWDFLNEQTASISVSRIPVVFSRSFVDTTSSDVALQDYTKYVLTHFNYLFQ